MKKTYHLCLSGGDEVMFRDEEDYIRANNCLCLAAHKTETSLLAYSIMSNHVHIGVRTENPSKFISTFRYPYTRYFNNKYSRTGRLGEKQFFQLEIDGLYHLIAVIAYILRNPLHHGVAATPFGYRYSSIGALFQKEFGRFTEPELMMEKSAYLYLPEKTPLPYGFKMDKTGLILPESVIDVADVEHIFSTARSFMFYMNRLSGEAWENEQKQDITAMPPVTLSVIEQGSFDKDMKTLLSNEYGRGNYNKITDLQLCEKIDRVYLQGAKSVYSLSPREKARIADVILQELRTTKEQIVRCLGGNLKF